MLVKKMLSLIVVREPLQLVSVGYSLNISIAIWLRNRIGAYKLQVV